MGKAFEKQTKTIKDQGEKQIKSIQDKSTEKIEKYSDYDTDYKNKLLISKERKIFKDIYNDRLEQIERFDNNIDYSNLSYEFIKSGNKYQFDGFEDPLVFLRNGKISIQEAKIYKKNIIKN